MYEKPAIANIEGVGPHILVKIISGRNANCAGHIRNLREEEPPFQPTQIRTALESARKIIQKVQETRRKVITDVQVNVPVRTLDRFAE